MTPRPLLFAFLLAFPVVTPAPAQDVPVQEDVPQEGAVPQEAPPGEASGEPPADGVPADAPAGPAPLPAFEPQLVRLVEILGSVEVLRGLCGGETGEWRARAQALIAAEGESEALRRRLVAAYNRGNRSLGAYRACTPSAIYAIERYMDEGERLARDVMVRYGD